MFANSRRDGKEGVAYLLVNNSMKEATEVVMEPNFYIGLMVDTIP